MASWMKKPHVTIGGSNVVNNTNSFTSTSFTAGQIGLFLASDNSNAAGNPDETFYIGKKRTQGQVSQFGTPAFSAQSPFISLNSITRLEKVCYAAPVVQESYLGYDGDTGSSLAFNCDTTYGIRFVGYSPYIRKFYNNQGLPFTWHITTPCCDDDCSADCGTADALAAIKDFVNTINAEFITNRFVGAEIVLDSASTDVVTGLADGTATFTHDSDVVTFTVAQTIADGALLRISPDGDDPPTDDDPVYEVETGTAGGTSITLVNKWQRADLDVHVDSTLADSELTKVTVADVTKYGILFVGKIIDPYTGCCCFPPFPLDYEIVSFTISDSLEASWPCSFEVNYAVDPFYGAGTARELLYTEMNAFGYTDVRQWFIDCASNIGYNSAVDLDTNYDIFYLEHSNTYPTTPMFGNIDQTSFIEIIAVPTGSTSSTNVASWFTALESSTGVPYVESATCS